MHVNIHEYKHCHGIAPKGRGNWMFRIVVIIDGEAYGFDYTPPEKELSYSESVSRAKMRAKQLGGHRIVVLP